MELHPRERSASAVLRSSKAITNAQISMRIPPSSPLMGGSGRVTLANGTPTERLVSSTGAYGPVHFCRTIVFSFAPHRIKNLVKLSSGEYIALERLEAIYKSCNLVANLCVYGHPDAKQPMAVIIPHEIHLRHALKQGAVDGVDPEASLYTLCEHPGVRKFVMENCNALGKKNGFKSLEILEAVVLTPDEWTPESGLVTAAQKLQRKKILEAFKNEIKVSAPFVSPRLHVAKLGHRKCTHMGPDDEVALLDSPRVISCPLVIRHRYVHDFVIPLHQTTASIEIFACTSSPE